MAGHEKRGEPLRWAAVQDLHDSLWPGRRRGASHPSGPCGGSVVRHGWRGEPLRRSRVDRLSHGMAAADEGADPSGSRRGFVAGHPRRSVPLRRVRLEDFYGSRRAGQRQSERHCQRPRGASVVRHGWGSESIRRSAVEFRPRRPRGAPGANDRAGRTRGYVGGNGGRDLSL